MTLRPFLDSVCHFSALNLRASREPDPEGIPLETFISSLADMNQA